MYVLFWWPYVLRGVNLALDLIPFMSPNMTNLSNVGKPQPGGLVDIKR